MKKYIVLSTNWNPDYLYYLPLTVWAWRKFGWDPIVFYSGPYNTAFELAIFARPDLRVTGESNSYVQLDEIEGYRSDTITQISRLYGACVTDGYLMTGDIDMLPLSDYWKFDENEITVWGHDLTGYGHYPICYIGMPSDKWVEVMNLNTTDYNSLIKRDLDSLPQAKDPDFYKYWFSDQDLITQRLKPFKKTLINRGQLPNGFARGRVDRGSWSLEHEEFIDCHMLRDMYKLSDTGRGNLAKTMQLLERVWPNENFDWFKEYTTEFQKLANNG
jgi:hypothetical protein